MRSKLEKFVVRNRTRNKHLYEDGLIELVDYIVCPVSGARLSMIKSSHIVINLGMTVAEFDERFPDTVKSCQSRNDKIIKSLREQDENGLTKHQISVEKSKIVKNIVGEDGFTINQRKAQKAKRTHLNTLDADGRNGYQLIAHKRNTTLVAEGVTVQQRACKRGFITKEKRESGTTGAIKTSKKKLKPIIDWLKHENIKHYFDRKEYGINYKRKYYLYDLVIPSLNIAVEFHGKVFHPNPNLSPEERARWRQLYSNKTADEVDAHDALKKQALLKSRGFVVREIYEDNAETQVSDLLDELLIMNESEAEFAINNLYEIRTSEGWKSFSGVIKKPSQQMLCLKFENSFTVNVTPDHEFYLNGARTKALDIPNNTKLDGYDYCMTSKELVAEGVVYDIVGVENKGHNFLLSNGLITKNCDEFSFVAPGQSREFWKAVHPTLGTGCSCIITSTPKSDTDQFAQIWRQACDNTDEFGNKLPHGRGRNDFFPVKVTWREHPERDEEWARPFRESLGENGFRQEMECVDGPTKLQIHDGVKDRAMTIEDLFKTLSLAEV
jgi:hypothetical protein